MREGNKINFAIIGAAGFIAPRHIKAIKETGNNLVAIIDPCDSIGIVDSYFPEAQYFRNTIECFECLKDIIDYVSICSPNYLHCMHCCEAMHHGYNVICEKPITNEIYNLDRLLWQENKTGKKLYPMIQLRYHPDILKLRANINDTNHVQVIYHTPRGNWYLNSWKGNDNMSGGLAMNIGIHFFDLLIWLFGEVKTSKIDFKNNRNIKGILELGNACVEYDLSIDNLAPQRKFIVNDKTINLSNGFDNLHTKVYRQILSPFGIKYGIEDMRPAIQLTQEIRNDISNKETEQQNRKMLYGT